MYASNRLKNHPTSLPRLFKNMSVPSSFVWAAFWTEAQRDQVKKDCLPLILKLLKGASRPKKKGAKYITRDSLRINLPGLHFSLPCVESHEVVDMRTITLSVPPQEVIITGGLASSVEAEAGV